MISALQESRPVFTTAISKGSGLVGETRLLLNAYVPGESLNALTKRASERDLLGRVTEQRTRDLIRRVFAKRFLEPTDDPARRLKHLLESRPYGRWFPDLCLLYAARADDTLRGAVSDLYGQAVHDGAVSLGTPAVESYLRVAQQHGFAAQPWSNEVRRKVARGLLQAMADFGLLEQARRSNREIRIPDPHPVTVAYLAYDLHFAGDTDQALVEHRDWRLWALDRADVLAHLDRIASSSLWIVQAAGSVVQMTWAQSSMEEALDAIARLDIR